MYADGRTTGQDGRCSVKLRILLAKEIASQVVSSYIRVCNASRPKSRGIPCSTPRMPCSLYRSHFYRDGVCVGRMKAAIRDVWGRAYSKFAIFIRYLSLSVEYSPVLILLTSVLSQVLSPWLHGPLLFFPRLREDLQWPKGEWVRTSKGAVDCLLPCRGWLPPSNALRYGLAGFRHP